MITNQSNSIATITKIRTQPLKGIAIQTTPAPLLGLQHAANVPG